MDCSSRKELLASGGRGPRFHLASFLVSAANGAETIAKFLTWLRKKLHNPKNCRTSLMLAGGKVLATALSLSRPGLIPSGVNRNPRYETF